jgi:hypothetical protein
VFASSKVVESSPMGNWPFLIGPAAALLLAFRFSPTWLVLLSGIAFVAFLFSFGTSFRLYDECDPCSSRAESMFFVNSVLFTLAPALFVAGIAKLFVATMSSRAA